MESRKLGLFSPCVTKQVEWQGLGREKLIIEY